MLVRVFFIALDNQPQRELDLATKIRLSLLCQVASRELPFKCRREW